MSKTIRTALHESLVAAAKHNRATQVSPAAVLWTDHDAQWQAIVTVLQTDVLQLFRLGGYERGSRQGPAIWLKCAVARTLSELEYPTDATPILYLPRVARTDLRAIEDCPRELQPLAELQYRGAYWSQRNTKDLTLFAFLVSDDGLDLDVAEDAETKQSLVRAAAEAPERFLALKVSDLDGKYLDAAFFNALLAPDHERDLLAWMDDSQSKRSEWKGARWKIFVDRCRADYKFHPDKDGELVAAENLSGGDGPWSSVWRLYGDLYRKYPQVYGLLTRISPPPDMFVKHANYPAINAEMESQLRVGLTALRDGATDQVRASVVELEKQHAERRKWLWAEMGFSPLAQALQPLAMIAELGAKPLGGASFEEMATLYCDGLWRIDDAALRAIAAVTAKPDVKAVEIALRALYVPWLEAAAQRFQSLVRVRGGLNAASARQSRAPYQASECVMFVDGLRYDVAQRLAERLRSGGLAVTVTSTWTTTPSVTASGKSWATPVADQLRGSESGKDFAPVVMSGATATAEQLRRLLQQSGWEVLSDTTGENCAGRAWTECGDLDHYGHEHGMRLARDIESQLAVIAERTVELLGAGWKKIRIVTDHGWLLVPGGLPKVELAKFLTGTRWGRCAVLRESSRPTHLSFAWDWNPAVTVALPPGIGSFIDGDVYAHGGLSLQESLVPVLEVRLATSPLKTVHVSIVSVTWQGLRCRVSVKGDFEEVYADLRLRAGDSNSSVADQELRGGKPGKLIENGGVSLAAMDEHEGTAATLVVLDPAGTVVAKVATLIGGQGAT